MKKMLSYQEIETLTGMTRVTIWRLVKKGEFPQPRKVTSRLVRFLESEVVEWAESRNVA